MTRSREKEAVELEKLVLISPSGHKYEIGVSDAGTLTSTYKPGAEKAEETP